MTGQKRIIGGATRIIGIMGFSIVAFNASASCEKALREFYVSYMQNADKGNDDANDKLKRLHMSPEVIAKVNEYTQRYDADAVIHAQDVSRYAIGSVTVEPMPDDDWYLVKYKWDADSKATIIPVQACDCDTTLRILDISPIDGL